MNIRIALISIVAIVLLGGAGYGVYAITHVVPMTVTDVATSTPVVATSTPAVATTTATTTPSKVAPTKPVKTTPVYTPPKVVAITPPPQPAPITPAPTTVAGYGTLTVSLIPLLAGGTVGPSGVVPVSYLQVNNTGTTTVRLSGFKLKENGSASDVAIIGLQTVDEKGGSRGLVGGSEATTPFVNGVAEATTNAILAPGEMKLFTIKVQVTSKAGQYAGSQIIISVTGLDATATAKGNFPIAGTTWTITW
jgi:hypothetical protein